MRWIMAQVLTFKWKDRWTKIENLDQNDDVYIKVRVELISGDGGKHVFVMSFHFAVYPFDDKTFPYGKEEQDGSN